MERFKDTTRLIFFGKNQIIYMKRGSPTLRGISGVSMHLLLGHVSFYLDGCILCAGSSI